VSAPGLWAAPAAALTIRLTALVVIAGELSRLAVMRGGGAGGGPGADAVYFEMLHATLIMIGLCLLIALLAPVLAAWSQLGAGRNRRTCTAADRITRALILVLPAILLMTDLNTAVSINLMSGPNLVQQLMQNDLSRIWGWAGLQLPLAILTVMLLSPALGAALNAARRGLQQQPPPRQASA
jgi:hypothetical protein